MVLKVAIVGVPFAPLEHSSLQLGLLKAVGKDWGAEVDDRYLHFEFASEIGVSQYTQFQDTGRELLTDWLFARAAFSDHKTDFENFYRVIWNRIEHLFPDYSGNREGFIDYLKEMENKCYEWIIATANDSNWTKYDIVGLSCSFSPVNASLSLARFLKQKHPNMRIVIGGGILNYEYVNEIQPHTPWIDSFVLGEGEKVFCDLLNLASENKKWPRIATTKSKIRLGDLPPVDYSSYFDLFNNEKIKAIRPEIRVDAVIETSRGCWWGEKHRCVFCGLVGQEELKFREKPAKRILEEVESIAEDHQCFSFVGSDCVLGKEVLDKAVLELDKNRSSFSFFFEVKSNITHEQLIKLSRVGFRNLQPGIESLNSEILKIMSKGATATQNIQFLKWSTELGINVFWNILMGFPGETKEQYEDLYQLMTKLTHLPPPKAATFVRLERYSPLYDSYSKSTSDKKNLFITNIRPLKAYEYIYPKSINKQKVAHFFDYDRNSPVPKSLYDKIIFFTRGWIDSWEKKEKPRLDVLKGINFWTIIDTRSGEIIRVKLVGLALNLAKLLDKNAFTIEQITKRISIEPTKVINAINMFIDLGFVISPDQKLIWLPISKQDGKSIL